MRDSTRKFMKTVGTEEKLRKGFETMSSPEVVAAMFGLTNPSQEDLSDYKKEFDAFAGCIDYDKLRERTGELIEQHLSEEDILALIDLHENNAVLTKLKDIEPQLAAGSQKVGMEILKDAQDRFTRLIQDQA